ncbi:hypothetical protein BC629DRAFT_853248 [Irpex lacteus]|nr:hypothetical protein BC629DRAFT_853248 [Irpex lacteus]
MQPFEPDYRVELFRTIVKYDDEVARLKAALEGARRELEAVRRERLIEYANRQAGRMACVQEVEEVKPKIHELEKREQGCQTAGEGQAEIQRLLDETRAQLEAANKQLGQSSGLIATLEEEKTNLKQSLVNLKQSLVNLEGQVRNKNQEIRALRKEVSEASSLQKAATSDLAASNAKVLSLQNKVDELEDELFEKNLLETVTPSKSSKSNTNTPQTPAFQPPSKKRTLVTHGHPGSGIFGPTTKRVRTGDHFSKADLSSRPPRQAISTPYTAERLKASFSTDVKTAPAPRPVALQSASPSPYVSVPVGRRRPLEAFPVITIPECATGRDTFYRKELMSILGGSSRWEAKTSRELATKHGLTACLYLTRGTNPWLPSRPGQHGYMFCGIKGVDEDDLKFTEPAERGLFIQENVNSWRYFGLYRVQRNVGGDLSKEEWQAFDESVVQAW